MKKRIIIMAVAIVLILSGCNPIGLFLSAVFESQDGDLRILYGRNGADYIYDHKVHLSYARGRREDYVGLYLDGESGKEQRILEADFQKASFENERLFILSDNVYYVLDISSFTVPEYPTVSYTNSLGIEVTEDAEIKYDLRKYSAEAFETEYPDNSSFEWISW